MTVIERAVVSRKTPGDGKLEVSPQLAIALGGDGTIVQVRIAEREAPGTVEIMSCTCAKAGTSGRHEHHFVQCDAFRDMAVGAELQLTAQGAAIDVVLGA